MKKQPQVGKIYFGIIIFIGFQWHLKQVIKNKSLQFKLMPIEWVEFLVFTIFRQLFDAKNNVAVF